MPDPNRTQRGVQGVATGLGTAAAVAGAANPIAGAALGLGAGLVSLFGAMGGRSGRRRRELLQALQRENQGNAMTMAAGRGLTPGAEVRAAGSAAAQMNRNLVPLQAEFGLQNAQEAQRRRLAITQGVSNALSSAGALALTAQGGTPGGGAAGQGLGFGGQGVTGMGGVLSPAASPSAGPYPTGGAGMAQGAATGMSQAAGGMIQAPEVGLLTAQQSAARAAGAANPAALLPPTEVPMAMQTGGAAQQPNPLEANLNSLVAQGLLTRETAALILGNVAGGVQGAGSVQPANIIRGR